MMGLSGGFGMFFGPLILIGLVVFFVYSLSGQSERKIELEPVTPENTRLQILDERLARGDIDEREYDEKRRVLMHG